MSDERLDSLIAGHFHDLLSPEDRAELEHRLQHSAADRAHFWKEAEMHALLHETLQADVGAAQTLQSLQSTPQRIRNRFQWGPLLWAAAGIVFGMFGASMLFAYSSTRITAKISEMTALRDGGFESHTGRIASGFPTQFGLWSGDQAETAPMPVPSPSGTASGKALRFLQAERESILPYAVGASCDVLQLIDLRPFKAQAAAEEAFLEMDVRFLDQRPEPGDPLRLMAFLRLFSGTPDALPASWPKNQTEAKAVGSGGYDSSGGQPNTWNTVSVRVLFPPEADFGVVHLIAHRLRYQSTSPALFREQFADDVRIVLKTHPRVPIRQARSFFAPRERPPLWPAMLPFSPLYPHPFGPLLPNS